MSNNIYDILGKLNSLQPKQNPDVTDKEPVYESVEPKGDIMEAVRGLEEKYSMFKKEEVKEEYCDVCDSKECKCDESIEEGKEFKNKEEFDKYAKTGDSYKSEKGRVTKTDTGIKHERSYAGDDSDKDLDESAKPDFLDIDKDGDKEEPMKKAAKDAKELGEVAPPGAKAERMVKHIKKGYSKDGKLTPKEKGIAYATAWKAHNKGAVEEATEFGDTIENSKADLTDAKKYVAEGELRNHPIYTTQEAWDHYTKELAEQEMQEEIVVDAVQELDEIARLAGLPTTTPIVEKSTLDETMAIEEAATRKDFRAVADLLKNIPDEAKRKELALHHADIFKQQNSRFKKEMFLAAAGVTEGSCTMEDEVEEGNEFSGALAAAKAAGDTEFEVDGKKYTVKEDININVSANGEEDVVNLIRKLSGMPVVAVQTSPAEMPCAEETVEEERDIEYVNTPREQVAGLDAAIPSGTDLNRSKVQDPHTANKAANPLAEAEKELEESLWKQYEEIIDAVKA
jgi:hypothetical protein